MENSFVLGLVANEIARVLGLKWKEASSEFKSSYERVARENRNIYLAELDLYKNQTSTTNSSPDTVHDFPSDQYVNALHLEDTFQASHYQFDIDDNHLQFDSMADQNDQ